ncbi:VOC family protein [Ruminococcaceae bacterium OttesenSCG-928-I18]|nr:VOC family protein [Ruminococcaceae bacterium OttesenSCG-928-I18]
MKKPNIYRINTVIDCAVCGAEKLARFYAEFLGWQYTHPSTEGWAAITAPDGTVFAFQEVDGYTPPAWPWEKGRPGQMIHLDFWVPAEELEQAVEYALRLGATMAPAQYYKGSRTLLDPAGHPFCIDTDLPED